MAANGKEPPLRPPGQMSLRDLYGDAALPPIVERPHAFEPSRGSRKSSISKLVAQISQASGSFDHQHPPSAGRSGHQVTPVAVADGHGHSHSHSHHAASPTATATPAAGAGGSSHSIEPLTATAANHDAIVKHFHLRRVVDPEPHHHNHHHRGHPNAPNDVDKDDTRYDDDGVEDGGDGLEDDPATANAQRMVNAAKIHEFRRRGSATTSMAHMIPVSKRHFQRMQRRWVRRLHGFAHAAMTPFSPIGSFSKARGLVLVLVMLIQLFVIPFSPVYFPQNTTNPMEILKAIFDICYVVDFAASCNTAYYEKPDQLEFSRRKILSKYIRSGWRFWLDLLSSIPADRIVSMVAAQQPHDLSHQQLAGAIMAGELHSIVRFISWASFVKSIWFLRVVRATKAFWFRLVYSRVSYAFAIAKIVLFLVFVTHYVACLWRFALFTGSDAIDTQEIEAHPWQVYVSDLYYAVQLLQGQGGATTSMAQSLYSIAAVLVGYLVVACITGGVALVLINFSSNSSLYQRKLESVFATMDKMQLPPQLQRRIHQYYNHLWFEHDTTDGDLAKFANELSPALGLEVRLYKYMNLVLSVPYWRNSSADFVTQIMLSLDVRAYLPEDYIVRQGEIGDGLFLINRGVCELTSCPAASSGGLATASGRLTRHTVRTAADTAGTAGAVNVRHLMAGHSFGELALLMNYRRTADVRAASYVEICVLSRLCFQRLLVRYREDRRDVLHELMLSCIEKSAMRFIAFPWEEMVDRLLLEASPALPWTSHTQLTVWEAADLLVDYISPQGGEVADTTVTFGFHDFDGLSDFQLEPVGKTIRNKRKRSGASINMDRSTGTGTGTGTRTTTAGSCGCHDRVDKLVMYQQQTMDRVASLETLVRELVAELRHR